VKEYFNLKISVPQMSKVKTTHLQITMKRVQKLAKYRATKRVKRLRLLYIRHVRQLNIRKLFFIDECHICLDHLVRRYGHSAKGEICQSIAHRLSSQRFSLLACINKYVGMVYYEFVDTTAKAIDSSRFNQFLHRLSLRLPKASIIVMDNASVHKPAYVKDIVRQQHLMYLFQSPYSPDYNPIEFVFGWIKQHLQRYEYSTDTLEDIIQTAIANLTPELVAKFVLHCQHVWEDEETI